VKESSKWMAKKVRVKFTKSSYTQQNTSFHKGLFAVHIRQLLMGGSLREEKEEPSRPGNMIKRKDSPAQGKFNRGAGRMGRQNLQSPKRKNFIKNLPKLKGKRIPTSRGGGAKL